MDEVEQRLFRQLGVFAGGFTLAAAEAVLADADVLDGLASLIDKSLMRREGDRYAMLGTVREYALEKLRESFDEVRLREAHARYYLSVAELVGGGSLGSLEENSQWFAAEQDNLRAALRWWLDRGDAEPALRLGAELSSQWIGRGNFAEGRGWLRQLLAMPGTVASPVRARALQAAALVAHFAGDHSAARTFREEALAISRQIDDPASIALAQVWLALTLRHEALYEDAARLYEQAVPVLRRLGPPGMLGAALDQLGTVRHALGDLERAQALYEESFAIWKQAALESGLAYSRHNQAAIALDRGDLGSARVLLKQALAWRRDVGDNTNASRVLDAYVALVAAEGAHAAAARLAGAVEGWREKSGARPIPFEWPRVERALAAAEAALGPADFAAAYAEGRAVSLEQAVSLALRES